MVSRSEKKSARDLCVCGHWRGAHSADDDCFGVVPVKPGEPERHCLCHAFRSTVSPNCLAKGAGR